MSDSDMQGMYDALSRQIAILRYATLSNSPRRKMLQKEYCDSQAVHALSFLERNGYKITISEALLQDARTRLAVFELKVVAAMEQSENPEMVVHTDIQARVCSDWINAQTEYQNLLESPDRYDIEQNIEKLRSPYARSFLQKDDADKTAIIDEYLKAMAVKEIYESELKRAKYAADKAKADMNFELRRSE